MKFFFLCALLHNWRILVLWFKTTHTSSTPWIFASFVLLHNWGILVLQFKTTHNSSTQWNFSSFVRYFTLKDFGSSIQNNSYFFNSMKIFILGVLLHNWRILVLRFKTTHISSTPLKISSFVCYFTIEGFWFFDSKQLILLRLHENILHLCATSQLKDFGSSIQNNSLLQIEFHSYLKHQNHWSDCVSKRKKKKKTTHTLCWSTICMPFQ
jgi:hypothetical protein